MTETIEEQVGDHKAGLRDKAAELLSFEERRRAGRQEVSPVLVPLLRDPTSFAPGLGHTPAATPYRDYLDSNPVHDPLATARGIALGLSISMLFWGAVGYMIFR